MVDMPFLLPHEQVAKLFEHGDANFILNRNILEEDTALLRAHAEACEPPRDPKTKFSHWASGATGSHAIGIDVVESINKGQ